MNIDEQYKRRIRIEGGLDETFGYQLTVKDLETGEAILNISRIVLYLDATGVNEAEVTYYEMDEQGKIVTKDGEPIIKVITLENPGIEITAFEV